MSDSPTPHELERIAGALGIDEALVEKDWHVVRALKAMADVEVQDTLVFTGGTCLSKAWGLIERFSEDVDFKLALPDSRPQRRQQRRAIQAALTETGFTLVDTPIVRDEGRFFSFQLGYNPAFSGRSGIRPHIKVEVTARVPRLPPIRRPIQSFVARARATAPEVVAIACADPIETAAEKLSALAWRVLSRGSADDDPSMIRHLYDLAALETRALAAAHFSELVRTVVELDTHRGNQARPKMLKELLLAMVTELTEQRYWRTDYEIYVRQVSYAASDRSISFNAALDACRRLVTAVL